jgi:hypothetical protein
MVLEALTHSSSNNELLVTYHLIEDTRRTYQAQPVSPTPSSNNINNNNNGNNNERAVSDQSPPPAPRPEPAPFNIDDLLNEASDSHSQKVMYSPKNDVWYLGAISTLHPPEVVKELFRTLKEAGFVSCL